MKTSLLTLCLLAAPLSDAFALGQLRNMAPLSGSAHSTSGSRAMSSAVGDIIAGHSPVAVTDLWHGFYSPSLTQVVGVDGPAMSFFNELRPIAPNPARQSATIEFGLAHADPNLTLEVYDLQGRRMIQLLQQPAHAGVFRVTWNLRPERGLPTQAGLYFVRLRTSSFTQTVRLIVVR